MSPFNEFLEQYGLKGTELDWDPFKEALACFDEENDPPDGVEHQSLFTIIRSGSFSGEERNFAGIFSNATSDEGVLYFADDAGGIGKLWRISGNDNRKIQDLVSNELNECGWGPLQFYDTTISNEAPDVTPREFFVRLVQEAFERHPDHIDASDEGHDSPEHFVEENYREWH